MHHEREAQQVRRRQDTPTKLTALGLIERPPPGTPRPGLLANLKPLAPAGLPSAFQHGLPPQRLPAGKPTS
jgi:hypothetical protein